ncbi:MAG: endo-1,4-beta-xylanase [Bacillota bacterium]
MKIPIPLFLCFTWGILGVFASESGDSLKESLKFLAEKRGILVGAAVAAKPLKADPLYAGILAREFNILTPENAMKFENIHPEPERYDFADSDAIVSFALDHHMKVRGHTLVWHNQIPLWLMTKDYTRDELVKILQGHISEVVTRYKGKVFAWDVVNEAINDDGTLRRSIWHDGIGPEYLELAFKWAHEADPDVMLFYNDYNGEGLNGKSDAVYDLVRGLLAKGIPIHGVGLQMHLNAGWYPDPADIDGNIKRLMDLGLQVHITEMDVRLKEPLSKEKLEEQAKVYREIMEICLRRRCQAYITWGFTDRYSWIPHYFFGWNDGLIFDRSYQPKPAYLALIEALKN